MREGKYEHLRVPVFDWRSDEGIDLKTTNWGVVKQSQNKIYDYDLGSVLRLGFFAILSPAMADGFVLLQALIVLGVSVAIAFISAGLDTAGLLEVDEHLCALANDVFSYFGALMGFLFGYFVFDQVGRARQCKDVGVGGYMGAFTNLMVLTTAWLGDDPLDKEFKDEMLRLGLSVYALLCMEGAGQDRDEGMNEIVGRGLLTAPEAAAIAPLAAPCNAPLVWMLQAYGNKLAADDPSGSPPPLRQRAVEDMIVGMRVGVGTVLSLCSGWGLIPLPLVHTMSGLVKWQFMLLAIKEGFNMAFATENASKAATVSQVGMSFLILLLTPIIFQSLLEVVVQLFNPFGDDWVDYPSALYHKGMRDEFTGYFAISENKDACQASTRSYARSKTSRK